tara:strand:- start:533 stop:1306 length:774 start_codon:yes stop_codon:yes gene_type:complete
LKKIDGYDFFVDAHEVNQPDDMDVFQRNVIEDQYGLRDKNIINSIPKVIFDCGSHIGAFSYVAKSLWPDSLTVLIEPNFYSLEIAKENIQQVSKNNSIFIEGGIWYGDKKPKYFTRNEYTKTSSKFVGETMGYYDTKVEKYYQESLLMDEPYIHKDEGIDVYKIEDIMNFLEIDYIDILKLDIQEAEYDFFKKTSLTSDDIGLFVGELHDCSFYPTDTFEEKSKLLTDRFDKHTVVSRQRQMQGGEEKYVFYAKREK